MHNNVSTTIQFFCTRSIFRTLGLGHAGNKYVDRLNFHISPPPNTYYTFVNFRCFFLFPCICYGPRLSTDDYVDGWKFVVSCALVVTFSQCIFPFWLLHFHFWGKWSCAKIIFAFAIVTHVQQNTNDRHVHTMNFPGIVLSQILPNLPHISQQRHIEFTFNFWCETVKITQLPVRCTQFSVHPFTVLIRCDSHVIPLSWGCVCVQTTNSRSAELQVIVSCRMSTVKPNTI